MIRRRLAAAAVRVCPRELRAGREAELLGTALDAGEASGRAFVAQLGSLVLLGLGARCRVALNQPRRRVWADAVGWAAVLSVAIPLVSFFSDELRHGAIGGSLLTVVLGYALPVLILMLFTAGRTRTAGMGGSAWALAHLWVGFGNQWIHFNPGVGTALLPAVGFALMACGRARPARSTRWLWILPPVIYALMSLGPQPGLLALAPVAALILLAVLVLWLDPAFALGTALVLAYAGAWRAIAIPHSAVLMTITLLGGLPLVLILATVGRALAGPGGWLKRRLRRVAAKLRAVTLIRCAARSLPALMISVIVFAALDWLDIRTGIACAAAFAAGAIPDWRLNRDWAWPVRNRGWWKVRDSATFTGSALIIWGASTWATGNTEVLARHARAGDLHHVLLSTAAYVVVQALFFTIKLAFADWMFPPTSTTAA